MVEREALEVARKFMAAVSVHYSVQTGYLFGSYAKGKAHVNSDIDVAIVLNQKQLSFDSEMDLVKLRRDIDLRIEPHAFLKNDFNDNNPLAREILTHGVPLV
ncbi:MAG: nucleotidyltransferase domain-containing protein [Flammeovirgaceae bacterium]|jgi:predicted nucleotidyltransferase|nr:nucleotidyltransferase domain-containing protein [Flammeovirgaceae bacterium]